MLKNWLQILPLFLIKIIARKLCPTVQIGKHSYHEAFPDVFIREAAKPSRGRPGKPPASD